MQGKLRIGLAAQTVLVSLAHAMADLQSAFPYTAPPLAAATTDDAEVEEGAEAEAEADAVEDSTKMEVDEPEQAEGSGKKQSTFQELIAAYLPSEHTHSPPEAIKLRRHMASERRLNKEELYLAADQAVKRGKPMWPSYLLHLFAFGRRRMSSSAI